MDIKTVTDQIDAGLDEAEKVRQWGVEAGEDFMWLIRSLLDQNKITTDEFREIYDLYAEHGYGFLYDGEDGWDQDGNHTS